MPTETETPRKGKHLHAAKLLLVEDDPALSELLEYRFTNEGYQVRTTPDGDEALLLATEDVPDLVILDWMIEGTSGIEVCRRLRRDKQTAHVPIIMLTAREAEDDRVRGLDTGADDYLTKPFHRDELVARIHAIIRRSKGHSQSVIRTGKISVNLDAKTVEVGGKSVHLTGKEYQMLELLSLRKGTTLTKEMFLNHLYGGMDEPELKIIDVFICKLRKKLSEATGDENYIETVWGRGYVLRDPEPRSDEPPAMAASA